jgi:two-component system, sensor histidine kinase YesM
MQQLNSVSSMSMMEEASSTQNQVIQLSQFLRYKYGTTNEIVSLQEELNQVKNLIELYKIRNGDRIEYSENIDLDKKNRYVLHYTLMTFVENCLFHAEDEVEEGILRINLWSKHDKNKTMICIEDNGRGFNHPMMSLKEMNPNSSISLMNEALKKHYDTETDLIKIETNPLGSTIHIQIKE